MNPNSVRNRPGRKQPQPRPPRPSMGIRRQQHLTNTMSTPIPIARLEPEFSYDQPPAAPDGVSRRDSTDFAYPPISIEQTFDLEPHYEPSESYQAMTPVSAASGLAGDSLSTPEHHPLSVSLSPLLSDLGSNHPALPPERPSLSHFTKQANSDSAISFRASPTTPHLPVSSKSSLNASPFSRRQHSVHFADEEGGADRDAHRQMFNLLANEDKTVGLVQLRILLNTNTKQAIDSTELLALLEKALARPDFLRILHPSPESARLTEPEFMAVLEHCIGRTEPNAEAQKQSALRALNHEALLAVKGHFGKSLHELHAAPKQRIIPRVSSMPAVVTQPTPPVASSPTVSFSTDATPIRPQLPRRLMLSRALLNLSDDVLGTSIPSLPSSNHHYDDKHRREDNGESSYFNANTARLALAKRFNSTFVQVVSVMLIVVDAFVVMLEILFFNFPCHVSTSCIGGATAEADECYHDYDHACHELHTAETILKTIGRILLFIFGGQIGALVLLLGPKFFRQPFFVMDLVVVGGAIALEYIHFRGAGLVILVLLWRVVRVAHALTTTIDIHLSQVESKVIEVQSTAMAAAKTVQKEVRTKKKRAQSLLRMCDEVDEVDVMTMNTRQLLETLLEQRKLTQRVEAYFIDLETTLSVVYMHIEAQKQQYEQDVAKARFAHAQAMWSDHEDHH